MQIYFYQNNLYNEKVKKFVLKKFIKRKNQKIRSIKKYKTKKLRKLFYKIFNILIEKKLYQRNMDMKFYREQSSPDLVTYYLRSLAAKGIKKFIKKF